MTEKEKTPQPEPVEPEELEDAAALKKALDEEKAKCADNLSGWQRAQADLINFKRRSAHRPTSSTTSGAASRKRKTPSNSPIASL